MEAATYQLCCGCASGVTNDDWTWLDAGDDADERHAAIEGALELTGYLVRAPSDLDYRGCVDCYLCGDVTYAPLAFRPLEA